MQVFDWIGSWLNPFFLQTNPALLGKSSPKKSGFLLEISQKGGEGSTQFQLFEVLLIKALFASKTVI